MNREKFYSSIKKTLYRKFNVLEASEIKINRRKILYLHYNNNEYAEALIEITNGYVYYYHGFKENICKMIGLNQGDFEELFGRWIEHKYHIKVNVFEHGVYCFKLPGQAQPVN